MTPTSYRIIADAVDFYGKLGYKHVEVPWAVSKEALDITRPEGAAAYPLGADFLVASGEQSFIQLMQKGELKKPGKYLCVTPCFREEARHNEYTLPYFIKVELILAGSDHPRDAEMVLLEAKKFFDRYLPKPTNCAATGIGSDIEYDGVELGSYGVRRHESTGPWIYGTGVAEPRFSRVLAKIPKGYTTLPVPRGVFGEISKILEEVAEFEDAVNEGVRIMELVELSDVLGAIDGYARKYFPGMTLDDIRAMHAKTARAFKNGYRK